MKSRAGWLAVLIGILALAAACGSTYTTTQPATSDTGESTQEILRRGAARMLVLRSAGFKMEHIQGSTTLFPGLEMEMVSGSVDIPNSFRLHVEAVSTSPRSFVPIDVVATPEGAFMTDFVTREWQAIAPEVLPFQFGDLGRTLADIITAVRAPSLLGTERIQGRTAYHIEGHMSSEDLKGLIPSAGQGFIVGMELWLGMDDAVLSQVLVKGKIVPTDDNDTERLLTIHDIDVPVEITLPQ